MKKHEKALDLQNSMLSLLKIGRGVLVLPFLSEEEASYIHPCYEIFRIVDEFVFQMRPSLYIMKIWDNYILSKNFVSRYIVDEIVGLKHPIYEKNEVGQWVLTGTEINIHTRTNTYGPFYCVLSNQKLHIRCQEIFSSSILSTPYRSPPSLSKN